MKWGRWIGQVLLVVVLGWFVGGTLREQWSSFQGADLQIAIAPGWLVLSGALAVLTFAVLIQSWRVILLGWNERLEGKDLAEVWFVANLGRYLPGKVWSIAGMIVLATRKGVSGWAASAAAVVIQALGLATALAVAAVALPRATSGWNLGMAALLAGGSVLAFTSPHLIAWIGRKVPRLAEVRPLPARALAAAVGCSVAGWIGYGASLWSLTAGLGLPATLPLGVATGGFALAYTAGLLALFAPGGLVVREGVLVAVLAPHLGAGAAVALSLGSRVVLTAAELLAATPFVFSWIRSAPRAAG